MDVAHGRGHDCPVDSAMEAQVNKAWYTSGAIVIGGPGGDKEASLMHQSAKDLLDIMSACEREVHKRQLTTGGKWPKKRETGEK